jgi:hypothetical protein
MTLEHTLPNQLVLFVRDAYLVWTPWFSRLSPSPPSPSLPAVVGAWVGWGEVESERVEGVQSGLV